MKNMKQHTALQTNRQRLPVIGLLLAMMLPFGLSAAPEIDSRLKGYLVVVDAEGNESFTPAETAEPGVVIEYRLQFENKGDRAAKDLAVIGPVPANTRYIANTANTAVRHDFTVSIDNGDTWEPEPVVRERKLPDGTIEQYVIPAEQYTHLRWQTRQRLGVDETHEYRYRVIVD